MTISYHWLQQYLPETLAPETLSHILTSVGLEVESMEDFESVKGGLKGLVIGEVMTCVQHPNADKLRLTQVNVGQEDLLSIVCGAPNVAVGQKVIVATVGTTIHPLQGDSFEIKKAKIRGENSEGMICAEDEIGLGESHDGIIVLPQNAVVGTPASVYYQIPEKDIVYEIGLTPNRMDAMCHLGVAKDVCAYLTNQRNQKVQRVIPEANAISSLTNAVHIDIQTSQCKRYAGIRMDHVTVKDSPEWLQLFLKAIGLKPINNIVDITNYILHECGQPLHAFDWHEIVDEKIIIKQAQTDTHFTTLDGKEIKLHAEDMVIANNKEAMCIAGVYGGLHSGVKNTTTSLFIESAWFEPESVRKTSLRHQLRTDAASRFEKGADISKVMYALHRAISLISELAGGQIASAIMDVYPEVKQPTTFPIQFTKIQALAGKAYPPTQIAQILEALDYQVTELTELGCNLQVPFSNPDVTMQADIVEEIMRIDGIDQIPFTGKINYRLPEQSGYQPNHKQILADRLVAKGFFEIFTNSITNGQYYADHPHAVKMMNSLSAHLDTMRMSMLETGLESIAYNLNRKNNHLKFFEFGRIYSGADNQFTEKENLALYVSAQYRLPYYSEKSQAVDVFYMKGIVEGLLPGINLEYDASGIDGLQILYRNKAIGKIIPVSAKQLKSFDIKQPVWYAALDMDAVYPALEGKRYHFSEIPKFPSMQRDLAMVVDKNITYQQIKVAVKQAKCKWLLQTNLFDVFESEKLGQDKISYAVNFTFYNPQTTLTDVEVEADMKMIIASLEQKVGASIRS